MKKDENSSATFTVCEPITSNDSPAPPSSPLLPNVNTNDSLNNVKLEEPEDSNSSVSLPTPHATDHGYEPSQNDQANAGTASVPTETQYLPQSTTEPADNELTQLTPLTVVAPSENLVCCLYPLSNWTNYWILSLFRI